jgi:hypothetical protein
LVNDLPLSVNVAVLEWDAIKRHEPIGRENRDDHWSLQSVQRLHLEGVSWELYDRLLKSSANRPLRLTYDDGELEITSAAAWP